MNYNVQILLLLGFLCLSVAYQPLHAQVTWTAQAAAEANSWRSVTYGNGLFVAVASDGTNRVMTSSDGITWTAQAAAEANFWFSVTYGNGLFVAVAQTGTNRVMTSPDGIIWTAQAAAETNAWQSVTYGNGLFLAVSSSGTNRVMTSPDGIIWTAQAASEAIFWRSVTYDNGLFVAVSNNGTNRVMTSPDGIIWTAQAAAEANQWRSVTYGTGSFVAVASDGANRVMTSPDGITWTARMDAEANSWHGVTYGNGLFVAVSTDGINRVMTSGTLVPVELSFFKGRATKAGVQLIWQTASEMNNKGFEVQRLIAGQSSGKWEVLSFVKGHGTTVETQNYQWSDEKPQSGVNYYRLKQLDYDGIVEYSNIVQIYWAGKEELVHIFPNPVVDVLNYQLADLEQVESIQLFDATGKLLQETSNIDGQLSLAGLPKGNYLLVVQTTTGQLQQQVVKE